MHAFDYVNGSAHHGSYWGVLVDRILRGRTQDMGTIFTAVERGLVTVQCSLHA